MNDVVEEVVTDFLQADCPYFPGRTALTEYNIVSNPTMAMVDRYLDEGWRRFGKMFFRPICTNCSRCIPLRLDLQNFSFSKSMRRALAKNRHIRIEIGAPKCTPENLALYNQYHSQQAIKKNWPFHTLSEQEYFMLFCEPMPFAQEYRYFDQNDKLLGVGYIDIQTDAYSSLYFFYDSSWTPLSPGIFSILSEIQQAKFNNIRYYHLGYYVKGCSAMSYKLRFQPHELLAGDGEVWEWDEASWRAHDKESTD